MKITAQMIVKNEENFVWYAINSVIDWVDEMLVWDNGSTDRTKSIIHSISNSKIKFAEVVGPVEAVRQKMLDETKADWIFILDGDEIWSNDGLEEILYLIKKYGSSKDLIVSPFKMLVGDIFHYQEEKAGRYRIKGKIGHLTIRTVRNFDGLHVKGYFGNEGYADENNVNIQNLSDKKIVFAKNSYLHASHLKRSSKGNSKYKYELGIPFPKDCYYPEVFFRPRPDIVPSPWKTMDGSYKLRALMETPLKKIKRRLI